MASELQISITRSYTKSVVSRPSRSNSFAVTVSGNVIQSGVASVGTSEEELALGEVATPLVGWLFIKNCDATHFVEVGGATGVYQVKLAAGETACLRMNGWTKLYAKADTAACLVDYDIYSN